MKRAISTLNRPRAGRPLAFYVLLGSLIAAPASADMEATIRQLRDEVEALRQELRETRREMSLGKAEAAEETERRARAAKSELRGAHKDGFGFTTGDGQHSIRLTGRVHTDYRWINDIPLSARDRADADTASAADGFELRRARLGFSGYLYRDIAFELHFNSSGGSVGVEQAAVNLGWYKPVQLRLGRFKQPFGLEQLVSASAIDFMERSYNDALAPGRKLGVMLHGEPLKGLTYAASVFQDGSSEATAADGDDKRYALRATANLAQLSSMPDSVLHLGVAHVGGDYTLAVSEADTTLIGMRTLNRGLSNVYRAQLGTTAGFGADVAQSMYGAELALAHGPWKLQAEYLSANYDAVGRSGLDGSALSSLRGGVSAYYASTLWNITGERWADAYSGGVFRALSPQRPFQPGAGWGAWQLGARYARFDASDLRAGGSARIVSGSAVDDFNDTLDSWSLGLNWIPNPATRLLMEYTRTRFGSLTLPAGLVDTLQSRGIRHEDVFSLRAELKF